MNTLTLHTLARWVKDTLDIPGEIKVKARAQNMAKDSRCARYLRWRKLDKWAVIWVYRAGGAQYYAAFLRRADNLDPEKIFLRHRDGRPSGELVREGTVYDFWRIK